MKKVWLMLAMMVCVFASCSDGGSDNPVEPTPKPEEVKTEITIDSGIVSNGLSFGVEGSEQSVSFSVNANWTLSVASTTSGATWCKASATSGSKGAANVKFTVDENTGYDDRSVSVTIKAGSVSKTFTITQKGADALLVTTGKYEVAQEGGQIEIEVKANIDYQMEISEDAKSWITEASSRALTTYKHTFDIALNEDAEKREGEITFKSGDKVKTVKVYQAGGALILLSQNEYTVSDAGETISVDIKSNVEYGVQMPDVDWITDEASSRGMSSHTLKYVIAPNEGYDSRSAEIIFYDKNSDLKDTLKVVQAQKDAIVISEKNFNVSREGSTIEVKVNTNVDFEVQIPSDVTWVSQTDSRALSKKSVYLKVAENTGDDAREVEIVFINKESQISESVTISQAGAVKASYENGVVTIATAGTMKKLLGDDYLNITSLKVVGPINGDDVYYLRKMLGGSNFSEADWGKLTTLDLSEATIVEGGEWYYEDYPNKYYTMNDIIGENMFSWCKNLKDITLPNSAITIDEDSFEGCTTLTSVIVGNNTTSIGNGAFNYCISLTSIMIGNNVMTIGDYVFFNCPLTSITIGSRVTSIGKNVFYGANFESITIPDSVISIGEEAFGSCSKLTSITIGNGITSIGYDAFEGCGNLRNVCIKDLSAWCNIEFHSYRANPLFFEGKLYLDNKELTELVIPNGISKINPHSFNGCKELKKVIIHDNVTSIGYGAFSSCHDLTFVSIGKSVKEIREWAFNDTPLSKLYCYATTPPSDYGHNFQHLLGKDATLYVPARCGSTYKSKWGGYFKNIVEMD